MEPKIVREKIGLEDLKNAAPEGDFIKFVVDIEKEIMAVGCYVHMDCQDALAKDGSRAENLWGANFYPDDRQIEFTSVVNIKPAVNRSMEIQNPEIRKKVAAIIEDLII